MSNFDIMAELISSLVNWLNPVRTETAATTPKQHARNMEKLSDLNKLGIVFVSTFMDFCKAVPELATKFCNVPGASSHHHNWKHGLLEHSIQLALGFLNTNLKLTKLTFQDCCLMAIFHDLCKIDTYRINEDGSIGVDGNIYPHHGTRSWALAQEVAAKMGIELDDRFKAAILFHMAGGWMNQEDIDSYGPTISTQLLPIIGAIQAADNEATKIMPDEFRPNLD